jgi:hypothetical protein
MSDKELPFSQRMGFRGKPIDLQTINLNLRNDLWNAYFTIFLDRALNVGVAKAKSIDEQRGYVEFNAFIWTNFLKYKIDDFPDPLKERFNIDSSLALKNAIRQFFDNADWLDVFELIEFILSLNGSLSEDVRTFKEMVNDGLKSENSIYRVIDTKFEPITSQQEIDEVENVGNHTQATSILSGIKNHWEKALECFGQKPNPDIQNTIKESISMVEAIATVIEPEAKSLGGALKKLEEKGQLDGALKSGFSSIYGYTSNKDGIRHAQKFDTRSDLDLEDARYFLISCSAFTNYLIEKARKQGILDS